MEQRGAARHKRLTNALVAGDYSSYHTGEVSKNEPPTMGSGATPCCPASPGTSFWTTSSTELLDRLPAGEAFARATEPGKSRPRSRSWPATLELPHWRSDFGIKPASVS